MDTTNRDQRDQARWVILLGTLAGALYLCWLMLKPFIGVLLWAAVLTMTFDPVHRRIVARTKSPNLSALICCVLVVLAIGVPSGLVSWAILHEIVPAVSNLEGGVMTLLSPESPYTGPAIQWLGERMDLEKARTEIVTQLSSLSTAARTVAIVGGVVGTFVQSLFVIFVMFYLFRDGKQVRAALSAAIPLRHRETYAIFLRTREVVGASVYGVLVIAVVQGALGGLAFWARGRPSAVLWSVAMMVLSLIPVTGAFVVWVPAAIYLAVSGAWISAILLTLWGTLVIGMIDNFLRPKLVGERAKLHELFIFFAVLGGLQVFGLLGIVLGPVVLAIAIALFDAFRHPADANASASMIVMPGSVTPTMLP